MGPQSLKYLFSDPLQKKCANPCTRPMVQSHRGYLRVSAFWDPTFRDDFIVGFGVELKDLQFSKGFSGYPHAYLGIRSDGTGDL